ncbi:MAG: MFS transporter [Bullifex sp.]
MALILLAVIYIAFISLGLPDSMTGSVWPVMHLTFGVQLEAAGLISMVTCCGTIISALLSGKLTRKFSTWQITVVSIVLTSVSLFLISRTTAFWQVMLLAFPLGLGGGSIDAALNNFVALHYRKKQLSFLHGFWGIGTLVGPVVISALLTHGSSWRNAYSSVSLIQFVIFLIVLLSLPLWKIFSDRDDDGEQSEDLKVKYSDVLRIKGVPFAVLSFMLYCAFENSAMLWSASYMVYDKGFDPAIGASLSGMVFLGITSARILNGLFGDYFQDRYIIRFSIVFITLSAISLIFTSSLPLCYASLFMLGMGFGPIFPVMIHETVLYYDRKHSQTVIGLQMAAAYTGSTLFPPLYGLIASNISQSALPFFILTLNAILALTVTMKHREAEKAGRF